MHIRKERWGPPFQGVEGVAQPKPADPAGWGMRDWAGPEPKRLAVEQGKVEARSWTGHTAVCGGDGAEGGREGTSQKNRTEEASGGRTL